MKKREISGKEQVPLPKIIDDEDEILEAAAVKAAQGAVGELTWLTIRRSGHSLWSWHTEPVGPQKTQVCSGA